MADAVWTEPERLAALHRTGLLDTAPEQEFDDLVRLTADLLGAPMAGIHLIAEDRQWGKAEIGLGIRELPRKIAFCPHALLDPEGLVVADATRDARFAANPLVTGPPGIRFYAGMPLLADGLPIGALCVIDTVARPAGLSERERFILRTLASQVSAQIALRRTLAERSRSEAHWRGLFVRLREGFVLGEVVRDPQGRIVDWRYLDVNPAWGALTGVSPEAATGRTVLEVFPHIDGALIAEIARVVETGEPAHYTRFIARTRRWYDGRAHRVDENRFAVLLLEVTQRQQAERYRAALLELGERLRDMQDPGEMSYVAAEALGRMLLADSAGYCTVHPGGRAVVERDWTKPGTRSAVGQHDIRDYGSFLDDLIRGQPVAIPDLRLDARTAAQARMLEERGVRALLALPLIEHGLLVAFIFAATAEPRPWTEDAIAFTGGVAERTRLAIERRRAESELRRLNAELERRVADRTAELMAAEASLRQAQKMEAVGQLTGGIAHDFNNMLQGIAGSLELMQRRIEQGRPADAVNFVAAAQGMVGRAAELTHRLLAFARRQALNPEPVDVNKLAQGMTELMGRTVGPSVQLDLRLDEGAWSVLCDPGQLENALLNLVINARDAMPLGGQLRIATSNVHFAASEVKDQEGASPGDYVAVEVSDTGTGMDDATKMRAFEPFFTTKPLGQGTGLGLSQLYGFIRQSCGVLDLRSAPGHGTTVRFCLPRHLPGIHKAHSAPSPATRSEAASGSGTILVVDDETGVRLIAAEHLRDLGYDVTEANDSASALRVLRSEPIRLLITDVGLPNGLNGRQLADAAREQRPALPVLLITGYAGVALESHLAPGMAILTKPFTLDALAARVQELSTRATLLS